MTKQPLCNIHSGCFYGLRDPYQQLDRLTLIADLTGFLINPRAVDFLARRSLERAKQWVELANLT